MRNVHMKFQNPSIHHSKANTHTHTDAQTHRQAENNTPFQLFQSWHKKQKLYPPNTSYAGQKGAGLYRSDRW